MIKAITTLLLLSVVGLGMAAGGVNINTADAETLATELKGVGQKKAEAIVQYRKEHGPFKSKEELSAVKGIGDKLIEDNADLIVVQD